MKDVLVVIARTDFDPHNDDQWKGIWMGYGGGSTHDANPLLALFGGANPEWAGFGDEDEQKFRDVSKQLWDQGKLHQPRKFGAFPSRRPEFWLETVLVDEDLNQRPAVKEAWDHFQVLAGLTDINLDREYR